MHKGKNPFRFGETVTNEYFANRKKEINDIINFINKGENIFVYSYRRTGKTSLVKTTLEIMKGQKKIISIYVDLQRATSCAQFLEVSMGLSEGTGSVML